MWSIYRSRCRWTWNEIFNPARRPDYRSKPVPFVLAQVNWQAYREDQELILTQSWKGGGWNSRWSQSQNKREQCLIAVRKNFPPFTRCCRSFLPRLSEAGQLRTLLLSPTPSEAVDSVINDRRSIKWPYCAVNSSRNGLHSHSKRDLWHEVKLEKNLEQPNIDSFLRLGVLIPKPAILAQFLQANLCSN